jgi:hypothetical protein
MSGLSIIGKLFSEPIEGDTSRFGSTEKKRGPKPKSAKPPVEPPVSKEALELVKSFEHLKALRVAEIKKENPSKEELINRLAHFELMTHLAEEVPRLQRAKGARQGGRRTPQMINVENTIRDTIAEMIKTGILVNVRNLKEQLTPKINVGYRKHQISKMLREHKSMLANKLDANKP